MTLSTADATLQSLRQLLNPDQIIIDEARSPKLASQIQSAFLPSTELSPVVYPQSVEELQSLVQWSHQDQKTVLVCGNGTKLAWGNPIPPTDVIISTAKLNQIIDHAVGDLTITVQAGLGFQALQTYLKPTGQMLPLDPYAPEQATIGGILATRDAGSLRHRYGGARDTCLGISFVRTDGELAKGGGRVVKNVAGYDLMKLFTGSFGTLGIISEVTLRLYPIQESSQTIVLSGSKEAIASITAKVLDSTLTPVAMDVLSQTMVKSIGLVGELGLAVRFQSLAESVKAQVTRLKEMGGPLQTRDYLDAEDERIWQTLRQTQWQESDQTLIAKVGMLPAAIPNVLHTVQDWCDQQSIQFQAQVLAGWGIGTVRLTGEPAVLKTLTAKIRDHCEQHQGYLSILIAPLTVKQGLEVWGYPGNAIAPMRKLKAQFDPQHMLNPGRFVGGI